MRQAMLQRILPIQQIIFAPVTSRLLVTMMLMLMMMLLLLMLLRLLMLRRRGWSMVLLLQRRLEGSAGVRLGGRGAGQLVAVVRLGVFDGRARYGFARVLVGAPAVLGRVVALHALVLVVRRALGHVHALRPVFHLLQRRLPVRVAIVGCNNNDNNNVSGRIIESNRFPLGVATHSESRASQGSNQVSGSLPIGGRDPLRDRDPLGVVTHLGVMTQSKA